MSLSINNVISSLLAKEIEELNQLLDNFDDEKWKENDTLRTKLLGLDQFTTEYLVEGEQLTGVTKWKDNRDGKEHIIKTHVEVEVLGKMNFKNYTHITTFNSREFKRAYMKTNTMDDMVHMHELYRKLFFIRAKGAFRDDPNTDFSPAFD